MTAERDSLRLAKRGGQADGVGENTGDSTHRTR
jgi:hypothetical protein